MYYVNFFLQGALSGLIMICSYLAIVNASFGDAIAIFSAGQPIINLIFSFFVLGHSPNLWRRFIFVLISISQFCISSIKRDERKSLVFLLYLSIRGLQGLIMFYIDVYIYIYIYIYIYFRRLL